MSQIRSSRASTEGKREREKRERKEKRGGWKSQEVHRPFFQSVCRRTNPPLSPLQWNIGKNPKKRKKKIPTVDVPSLVFPPRTAISSSMERKKKEKGKGPKKGKGRKASENIPRRDSFSFHYSHSFHPRCTTRRSREEERKRKKGSKKKRSFPPFLFLI